MPAVPRPTLRTDRWEALALLVVSALCASAVSSDTPLPTRNEGAATSVNTDGDSDHHFSGTGSAAAAAARAAWMRNPVERLIEGTGSSMKVYHLDLNSRGGSSGGGGDSSGSNVLYASPDGTQELQQPPWFEGFTVRAATSATAETMAAVVTIGHPIRRLLSYFVEVDTSLEESLAWMDGEGTPANSSDHFRRGYQVVDNYLVRVLGGRAAWELPPGEVGADELKAARIALGKFEVILRQDCLSTDLALLRPYLDPDDDKAAAAEMSSDTGTDSVTSDNEGEEGKGTLLVLPPGGEGQRLVRSNRWDLQLWEFANGLAASRSSTLEGYLCGSSELARSKNAPGQGRRAVVFNSPDFHLTGVSMFSCTLMSIGYHVTAVVQRPVAGFEQLLPCAHVVIPLKDPPPSATELNNNATSSGTSDPAFFDRTEVVLNSAVAAILGLPPASNAQDHPPPGETGGEGDDGDGGVAFDVGGGGLKEQGQAGGGGGGTGGFDVSVLCTTFGDLNALFDTRHSGMDPRLADALLWNVNTSIWNVHGVDRAFSNGGVPPMAHDFAARLPTVAKDEKQGRMPPPTFLTVYGEHVKRYEESLEEAYEGWGGQGTGANSGGSGGAGSEAPAQGTKRRKKVTNLRGLFPRPGVVYPIVPTGHMRLPRPRPRPSEKQSSGGGDGGGGLFNVITPSSTSWSFSSPYEDDLGNSGRTEQGQRVNFVVQGTMVSERRDYKGLFRCLEEMCTNGRDNFSLEAVGSSGNITGLLGLHPCTSTRYTEGRNLEYNDFYARIAESDFVVTAAAGHDYEFDRATSSVPTALLLEKPLVMASSLLDAYPCLRNSRVHTMVANDDLCLNLQAAYDLTPREYDEMELEARDCKLRMWRQTRRTVSEIIFWGRHQR